MQKLWWPILPIVFFLGAVFLGGFYFGSSAGRAEVTNLKRDYATALRAADAASNAAISDYRLALDGISERSGDMAERLRVLADTSTVAAGTLTERLRVIIGRFKEIQSVVGGIREINESANRALADGNPGAAAGIGP